MLILRDLYTQVVYVPITTSTSPCESLGWTVIQYEVRAYTDTRNLTATKSYTVTCTQRIVLPGSSFSPSNAVPSSYSGYPAMVSNTVALNDPNSCIQSYYVTDYAPRTLNTAVSTSQNNASDQSVSISQQHSSGSSTAQTNTYGVSASLGFFGEAPTGGVSGSYEHSSSSEQSQSSSFGNALDRGSQLSNSSSMSIKDWASYAMVDINYRTLTWIFGQEYPWNVIQFNGTDGNGNVVLPRFIQERLYDGTVLFPPSELSMLGVDLPARVSWLVTPSAGRVGPAITFTHTLIYRAGTHKISDSSLVASLDTYTSPVYISPQLDLQMLALDPILPTDSTAAIIGFVANKFDVVPSSSSEFQIVADSNNLLARGSGFTQVMYTDFSAGAVTMQLFFKIVDSTRNVVLSLKHWIEVPAAVRLDLKINGTSTTLTKFVNSPEAGSGGDNVMLIALRNKDYTSTDYCDYLQMGVNSVVIEFTPVEPANPTNYQVLAVAVG